MATDGMAKALVSPSPRRQNCMVGSLRNSLAIAITNGIVGIFVGGSYVSSQILFTRYNFPHQECIKHS